MFWGLCSALMQPQWGWSGVELCKKTKTKPYNTFSKNNAELGLSGRGVGYSFASGADCWQSVVALEWLICRVSSRLNVALYSGGVTPSGISEAWWFDQLSWKQLAESFFITESVVDCVFLNGATIHSTAHSHHQVLLQVSIKDAFG